MEFTCNKKDIQNGVSLVERIVTTKSTLPIIGNILLEAEKNSVKLSANNLEIGIELEIEAKVTKSGAVLLPAKTLAGIVSKLPEGKVGIKLNENGRVRISYGQSHLNVHTLPPDEFPMLPKVKEEKSFSIDPKPFALMIRQTIFAVSSNEDKYILTGVLLENGKSGLAGDTSNIRMVATDGYRMAKRGEKIKTEKGGQISVIVPSKALVELLRVLEMEEKENEALEVVLSSDQIAFRYGKMYLVSRLIQGQFPDYKQVIPKKCGGKILISTREFLQSAERAAVIASGSANIVHLELKGGELHLSANTPDVGSIDERVEAEVKEGEKIQVAFNVRLITDVLKAVEGDKVQVEFAEALGPGIFKETDKNDFIYIVMPIRTQEAV